MTTYLWSNLVWYSCDLPSPFEGIFPAELDVHKQLQQIKSHTDEIA